MMPAGQASRQALRSHRLRAGGNMLGSPTRGGALANRALADTYGPMTRLLGHGVLLLAGKHGFRKLSTDRQQSVVVTGHNIQISEGAWIASNVIVLGPCIIGEHSVVAAGSVVTSAVPPFAIAGGIPARIIKHIERR